MVPVPTMWTIFLCAMAVRLAILIREY